MKADNTVLAIINYRKSLELNSKNENINNILTQL